MVDKSNGMPAYKQIAASIRMDIGRGVYPEGGKLPNEDELARMHGVSRGTVRQAIGELSNQGIVKRIHGSGTFVCEPGDLYKIETDHFISFLDSLENAGGSVDTVVLDKSITKTQEQLGDALPAGIDLFSIKRLRKKDGRAIMFSIDNIPVDLAPGIDIKYKDDKSVYDFLEKEYSLRVSKVKRIFYAIAANGEVAKALSLKEGEPVFYIKQQAFDDFGRCVDFANLYIKSELMHFSISTSR